MYYRGQAVTQITEFAFPLFGGMRASTRTNGEIAEQVLPLSVRFYSYIRITEKTFPLYFHHPGKW